MKSILGRRDEQTKMQNKNMQYLWYDWCADGTGRGRGWQDQLHGGPGGGLKPARGQVLF